MLLDELVKRQRTMQATDRIFAALLGMPRATWQAMRTSRRPLSRKTLLRAMAQFPELRPMVVSFLLSDATSAADGTTPDALPAEARNSGEFSCVA